MLLLTRAAARFGPLAPAFCDFPSSPLPLSLRPSVGPEWGPRALQADPRQRASRGGRHAARKIMILSWRQRLLSSGRVVLLADDGSPPAALDTHASRLLKFSLTAWELKSYRATLMSMCGGCVCKVMAP